MSSEPDPEPEPRSPQPADDNDVPRPSLTLAHWPPPSASRDPSEPYTTSFDHLSPFPLPTSFFDDAIAAHQPSPSPPASFLDHILNPVSRSQSRSHEPIYLPFGYQRASSPQRRPRSPVLPYILPDGPPMSPARQRPSRLPNGYVDLTHDPEPAPAPAPAAAPSTRRKRGTPTPGPSAKRTKHSDSSSGSASAKPASGTPDARIDEIDLSDDKVTVQEVLQKQRVDAVKAQAKHEEKPTTFNSFTCVICMDTPTDITATSCGHLFCHTCLMEALIAGENRAGPNEPKRSQCPVCRKFINRTKASDIIPLLLKKGLATQPRKSSLTASMAKS